MSGKKPFFLTGATAKIKINGRTIAYCNDISYSVSVNHKVPIVLGMYEGSSVEPLSYRVTGTFSVIRTVADVNPNFDTMEGSGNGLGALGSNTIGKNLINGINPFKKGPLDGRPYDNFDPSALQRGTTFTIEIYQRVKNVKAGQTGLLGQLFGGVKELLVGAKEEDSIPVARLRNCRLTRLDFAMSKRQATIERYQFTALYADEDSFLANPSGQGQTFAQ